MKARFLSFLGDRDVKLFTMKLNIILLSYFILFFLFLYGNHNIIQEHERAHLIICQYSGGMGHVDYTYISPGVPIIVSGATTCLTDNKNSAIQSFMDAQNEIYAYPYLAIAELIIEIAALLLIPIVFYGGGFDG